MLRAPLCLSKEYSTHPGASPHSWGVSLSLSPGFPLGHYTTLRGRLPDIEETGPYRDITDGESRDALSVGGQASHVGKVVQVPQDAGAVLGATDQEAEGDRRCQACDSLGVSIQGLGTRGRPTGMRGTFNPATYGDIQPSLSLLGPRG